MRPVTRYVNHFLAIVGGLAVLGGVFGALAIDTMVMIGAGGTLPLVALDLHRSGDA